MPDLNAMSDDELRAYAADLGVEDTDTLDRQALIEAIQARSGAEEEGAASNFVTPRVPQ